MKLLLLSLIPFFQVEEISSSREILLKFSVENPKEVKQKILWVTINNGKNWVADSIVKNIRHINKESQIYTFLEVPKDGTYGFYLQLEDLAGNITPPPGDGTKPQIVITVDSIKPILQLQRQDKLISTTLSTGVTYTYQEQTDIKEKILWFSRDRQKWNKSTEHNEVSVEWQQAGNEISASIHVERDGKYWFCVQIIDMAGNSTAHPGTPEAQIVEVEFTTFSPQIVLPKPYDVLTIPNVYVIKWVSPQTATLKEKTASLYYRFSEEKEWIKISEALDLSGLHLWSPPLRNTRVDLKLEVKDIDGNTITSPVIQGIKLQHEKQPDIKRAIELYKVARLYLAQKDYEKALSNYYLILSEWETFPQALNDIANIYYENGEKEKSLEFFYKAHSVDRSNSSFYLNIAICLHDLHMYEKSVSMLHDAIILTPDGNTTQATKSGILILKLFEAVKDQETREKLMVCAADAIKLDFMEQSILKQIKALAGSKP